MSTPDVLEKNSPSCSLFVFVCSWELRNTPRQKVTHDKFFCFPWVAGKPYFRELYKNGLNNSGLTLPGKLFLAPILLGKSCLIFFGINRCCPKSSNLLSQALISHTSPMKIKTSWHNFGTIPPSLKLTARTLKMDGWKMIRLPFGMAQPGRCELFVPGSVILYCFFAVLRKLPKHPTSCSTEIL